MDTQIKVDLPTPYHKSKQPNPSEKKPVVVLHLEKAGFMWDFKTQFGQRSCNYFTAFSLQLPKKWREVQSSPFMMSSLYVLTKSMEEL